MDFKPKRDTFLGYFAVKEEFDEGQECIRFRLRQKITNGQENPRLSKLKSDLSDNNHEYESVHESINQMQQMRGTDYSTRSNRPWMNPFQPESSLRKLTSSNHLSNDVRHQEQALVHENPASQLRITHRKTEGLVD